MIRLALAALLTMLLMGNLILGGGGSVPTASGSGLIRIINTVKIIGTVKVL